MKERADILLSRIGERDDLKERADVLLSRIGERDDFERLGPCEGVLNDCGVTVFAVWLCDYVAVCKVAVFSVRLCGCVWRCGCKAVGWSMMFCWGRQL